MNMDMDFPVEKLKGEKNYQNWKFIMEMILINEDLIDCISDNKCNDDNKVQKALAKICLSVSPVVLPHNRKAKTAYQAWSNLQKVYEQKGLVKRVDLLRQLSATRLGEAEEMVTYLSRVLTLGHQLADSGLPLDDELMSVIILSGLTTEYDPLIMSLEISGASLNTESLRSKLISEHSHLTILREQNSPHLRQVSDQKVGLNFQIKKQVPSQCFICGEQGHLKRECPNNPKKPHWPIRSVANNGKFGSLSTGVRRRDWCIDLTTPYHMCCDRHIMINMNGCTVQINMAGGRKVIAKGIGETSVVLHGGYKQRIQNVYYVPELSTNLLSVTELNRKGFQVIFDDEKCKILKGGDILRTASCVNGIYKLDIQ